MNTRIGTCNTKVKVYNMKEIIEATTDYTPHMFTDDTLNVIEGPGGSLVFNFEGVGEIIQAKDLIEIPVMSKTYLNSNKRPVLSQVVFSITLDKLKANSFEEKPITECIRVFGTRLELNFKEIVNAIQDIGLSSEDYYQSL